ncbi:MAG: hypothetical protein ACI4F4_09445, partial [Lachnospiraceae bacterium]
KNIRSDVLLSLTAKQKKDYENSYKGEREWVLVEERISKEQAEELVDADIVNSISKSDSVDYYTGHTRNYIKVAIASSENLVNSIVEVHIL